MHRLLQLWSLETPLRLRSSYPKRNRLSVSTLTRCVTSSGHSKGGSMSSWQLKSLISRPAPNTSFQRTLTRGGCGPLNSDR